MNDSEAWNAGVSSHSTNIYRCADKSSWYNSVIEAYDRTRPRYPAAILAYMQEKARLKPGKSVLEIGSGPGIATIELAKLGANVVCLEPNQAACELVRGKCATYSNVEVVNSTFEEWKLGNQKFDAVVAATSFHWVSPEIRNQKAAAALKDRGLLILMWNTPPKPSYKVFRSLAGVYQKYAPELAKYEEFSDHEHYLQIIGEKVLNSGYFSNLTSKKLICGVTYSIDDYLTLLSTLSPYIRLESEQRRLLLTELKRVLKHNYGNNNHLELDYLSLIQIAQKV